MRSDCVVTVGKEFWEEFKKIDAINLYTTLAKNNRVEIILAGADEVLGKQESPPMIHNMLIPDANHDFMGNTSRHKLLQALKVI